MANQTAFLLAITITTTTLLLSFSSHASACHGHDRKALLSIQQALGNPDFLSPWLPDTDCCTWIGLTCNDKGRVNNFVYESPIPAPVPFPSALADLPFLEYLFIGYIPLYGPIPASLTKLSHLQKLIISGTSLSGPIPDFPCNSKLQFLDLSSNKLSGPIPRSLTMLPSLGLVFLENNQLTGSIPRGLFHRVRKGTGLSLDISGNQITGDIPQFHTRGVLFVLNARGNNLTGATRFLASPVKPKAKYYNVAVYLTSNMLRFDFSKVTLSPMISDLDLGQNMIRGSIPESTTKMEHLFWLNVSYNELCSKIPVGGVMSFMPASMFEGNKCLCGTPLPACAY